MASVPRRTSLAIIAIVATGVPFLTVAPASASSLGTPSGLAPNSGSTQYKDPVLSWHNVAGASGYQVEVSRSDDFSDPSDMVKLPQSTTTSASLALPQTLVHASYWWRVQAHAASGNSAWSAPAQVVRSWDDAPSILGSTPTGDATTTPGSIADYPWRFAWTPVPDASSYEVEVSTNSTFPQPGTVQSGHTIAGSTTVVCLTTATSFTPYGNNAKYPDTGVDTCDFSQFAPTATAYWRVRAIDDSTQSLLKASNQPTDFECFGVPVEDGSNLIETTQTALGTPKSGGQECSNWSTEGTFPPFTLGTGSASTPGAVSGLSLNCPAGSGGPDYACTTMPEISWDAVAGVSDYAVTIADDPSFTNVEHAYSTPFLSLTPRDQLADYTAGKGYYVAVQSCTAGLCGPATVKSFTKRTPTVAGLSATKVQGGERLSWNDLLGRFGASTAGDPAVEAEQYEVQVATDSDFTHLVVNTKVDAACDSTQSSCYQPPSSTSPGIDQVVVEPSKSGSYIWRVLPIDLSGNVLPAAVDTHAFTVDVTPPALSLTTKSGLSITGSFAIRASEPVTGVSASTVHVVRKGTTTPLAGKLRQGSTPTSWVFAPASPLITGATYVLTVSASVQDQSGNSAVVAGRSVRTTRLATNRSKGWTYSSGWHRHSASGARSGSYKSARAGHSAAITVVGGELNLYACKAPSMGTITVTVGGHRTKVSEHQSFTRCGVLVFHRPLPAGAQRVKIAVTNRSGNIDEITVT